MQDSQHEKVYAGKNDITVESIKEKLDCSHELAATVLDICESGYSQGLRGLYPDGDYSSDADWCYGIGNKINTIEYLDLDTPEHPVFELYMQAHGTGLDEREEAEEA